MMGKGKARCVVRNKVVSVNICCVVSDPTSYNWPRARATTLKVESWIVDVEN